MSKNVIRMRTDKKIVQLFCKKEVLTSESPSVASSLFFVFFVCWELNLGPHTGQASTLLLSKISSPIIVIIIVLLGF
jgi:hypothetical protein